MVPKRRNKKKVPIILSQGLNPIFERSQSVGSPVTFGHSHFMNRIFFLGLTGLLISCEVVYGAAHGGAAFYDEKRLAVVKAFLRRHF